ncbi:hypothetical protein DHD08_17535 [Arenibacter sp. H213]|nr:hypothetical protein [Arenibacter sp. H213]
MFKWQKYKLGIPFDIFIVKEFIQHEPNWCIFGNRLLKCTAGMVKIGALPYLYWALSLFFAE